MRTSAPWLALLFLSGPTPAQAQRRLVFELPTLVDAPPNVSLLAAVAAETAERAVAATAEAPRGELLVALVDALPDGAPRGPALLQAIASPLVAALRADARFPTVEEGMFDSTELALGAAAARGFETVVVLSASVDGNVLEVEASAHATGGPGFRPLFRPAPRELGRSTIRAGLDAELRSYSGALPRVDETSVRPRSAVLPGRGYVAMATADLDGDGTDELVLAAPTRVDVVRLLPGGDAPRLEPVGRVALPELPGAASRPLRPIGTAVPFEGGVLVRLSDHGGPALVRAGPSLAVAAVTGPCEEPAYPLPDACAVAAPGRDYFGGALRPRAGGATPSPAPASFYARSRRPVRQPDGTSLEFEVVVTPRGRIATSVAGRGGAAASGYGTAIALADLDQDGAPELLASAGTAIGEGDRLSVLRVRPAGTVYSVWLSDPIQGSVLLAAAADLDGDGVEELLAVEESHPDRPARARLWIVR